jgi:hypothetical protein
MFGMAGSVAWLVEISLSIGERAICEASLDVVEYGENKKDGLLARNT